MTATPAAGLDGLHLAVVGLGDAADDVVERVARRLEMRWYLGGLERVRLGADAGRDEVAAAAGGARVVLVSAGPWSGETADGWVLVDADGAEPGELARLAEDALLGRSPDEGPTGAAPPADGPVCAC